MAGPPGSPAPPGRSPAGRRRGPVAPAARAFWGPNLVVGGWLRRWRDRRRLPAVGAFGLIQRGLLVGGPDRLGPVRAPAPAPLALVAVTGWPVARTGQAGEAGPSGGNVGGGGPPLAGRPGGRHRRSRRRVAGAGGGTAAGPVRPARSETSRRGRPPKIGVGSPSGPAPAAPRPVHLAPGAGWRRSSAPALGPPWSRRPARLPPSAAHWARRAGCSAAGPAPSPRRTRSAAAAP